MSDTPDTVEPEVIELEIVPIPPDTVASVKEELRPLIEAALREAGRADLLSEGHIRIQIEKTFPTDAAIIVGLTLFSGIALETYQELLLPRLKQRFEVKQKAKGKKPKARTGKKPGQPRASARKTGRGKK